MDALAVLMVLGAIAGGAALASDVAAARFPRLDAGLDRLLTRPHGTRRW